MIENATVLVAFSTRLLCNLYIHYSLHRLRCSISFGYIKEPCTIHMGFRYVIQSFGPIVGNVSSHIVA